MALGGETLDGLDTSRETFLNESKLQQRCPGVFSSIPGWLPRFYWAHADIRPSLLL